MTIKRFKENPIITPEDVKPYHEGFEVIGAFNAGVAEYNGETLLLMRVAERPIVDDPSIVKVPVVDPETREITIKNFSIEDDEYNFDDPRVVRRQDKLEGLSYLTSLSYVRIARSKGGIEFSIDDEPFLYPYNDYQTFGIEDPRVTKIDDTYYIDFTSVSEKGVAVSLVTTKDFESFTDQGIIFAPENKDVVLFPEKINGLYYALHRPVLKSIGNYDIWIAESPDTKHWGNHQHLAGVREGNWDEERIGAGLTPVKTSEGWVVLYHGASHQSRYCMGALLLDLEDPTRVLARSEAPFMEPEEDYEKNGFFNEVVFGCGATQKDDDSLTMYYGVADTSIAGCDISIQEIITHLKESK
ncbi:glycoside hydrolase family 130 protein [Alkalibacterium putridalgicola]|uniref:BtaManbiosPhlase n=1 Tax=Alkalibacterium putridalgicola TaxID=426703 RepID=UPI0034CD4AB2